MKEALILAIIMLALLIAHLYVALNKLERRVEKLEQDMQRKVGIEVVGNATGYSVVGADSVHWGGFYSRGQEKDKETK